jgi:hypothetical protein
MCPSLLHTLIRSQEPVQGTQARSQDAKVAAEPEDSAEVHIPDMGGDDGYSDMGGDDGSDDGCSDKEGSEREEQAGVCADQLS